MTRKIFFSIIMALVAISANAQSKYQIKGSLTDKETNEEVVGAMIQLLSLPDSNFVSGTSSSIEGTFKLEGVKRAKYTLKVSLVGYTTRYIPITIDSKSEKVIDIGGITMSDDAKLLSEVVVTANAAKVQASGDSLVYNASAYRVPEGSTLEALVKLLPGAQVDDNGKITINGKEVTKILLNGKEFFLNDMETAMKNIPTDMIEKIKTYEKKSDLARITGIDDGQEETVLDLSVKKGMNSGWFGNITGALGTKGRYDSRAMINRFNETTKISLVGNMRNTPNRWGWNNGRRTDKRIGLNITDSREKLETEASVMYTYNGSDITNESSSEDFVASKGAFKESHSSNTSSNNGLNANIKMEWKPDTMTNIIFRPNVSYSRNRGANINRSGSYDIDPNILSPNILEYNEDVAEYSQPNAPIPDDQILKDLIDIVVNTNTSRSQSYSSNVNGGMELQYNRRLNNKGRNITVRVTGNISDGRNKQISAANITYNTLGTTQKNNRYYDTPSNSHNASGQITYNEPIANRTYLQFSYQYRYSYSKNDRRAFVYDSDAYRSLTQSIAEHRYDITSILESMEELGYMMRDTLRLSQFSEYKNYNQTISLQFRRIRDNYNISLGVDAYPQHTLLNYMSMGVEYPEVTRTVFNMAPRANLRWIFDRHTNLRVRYQGRTSQPSMVDLLDIVDDSNPLYITRGNPNLRPSFSHEVRLNFNTYKPEKQRGMWFWGNFNTTSNSISNKTTYDPVTGIRTTMPKNINGNWNMGLGGGMNTTIGAKKLFNAGGYFGYGYSHNVGFYNNASSTSSTDEDIESVTGNTWANGGANISFRNNWLYVEVKGDINYNHLRNNVNPSSNQDTYRFSYGTQIQWTMPWGTELASDIRMSSRRGYSVATMNTNELLWNASISHSMLKGKALTLKAEMFDILHQQTNISRSVDAFSRRDSHDNTIYQYAMFSAIFRFSIYGGKNTMGTDKEKR